MQLQGKTVLVTGGTDGIGAQLIRQLRDKGAAVITQGRNPERVAATRADGFEVIQADLGKWVGVGKLLKSVEGRPIDILINNAGAGVDHDFRETAPDLVASDDTIFLNLNAPIHLIATLMPVLKARNEAMIVNVTSGLAIAPRAGGPVYCATKAGLRSYTQALRFQLKGTKVHVLEARRRWSRPSLPLGGEATKWRRMHAPDRSLRRSNATLTKPMSAWLRYCNWSIRSRPHWRGGS